MYQQYPQYPQQQPAYYQQQQQYSGCLKFLLYAVSLLWPLPIGFIVAIVFISRPDAESKSLGNTCLILSIVSMVVLCCLTIVGTLAWPTLLVILAPILDSMNY
ncbi:MAG: hypothetical protein AB8I69_15185 [Anaerolineae bacterium]|jgi:hypothetical protein